MKASRRILVTCGLVLASMAALGWTWTWAQTKATQAGPLALLPAGTVVLLVADGDAMHKVEWEKTAAYDAFRKSGLVDSLMKLVREVIDHVPDGRAQAALQIYNFVSEHGLTAAVGLPAGDGPVAPYLTVVAHDAGPHADVLVQFVDGLGPQFSIDKQKVAGRMVSRVKLPDTPDLELAWWAEGKHLVLTIGVDAANLAIAVADGKSPNFAATAQGKKLAAKPEFDRTGLFMLDVAILRDRFGSIPLPPTGDKTVAAALKSAGLDSLNRVFVQSGYKGRGLWSTIDVDAPGPRKGLLGLADPKTSTMTMSDLPPLPVNHVGFGAHSMSLTNAYDELLELTKSVATLGPPQFADQLESVLEQMPDLLGCDLRDDLLAALGSVQCVYSDSSQGMFGADYGLVIQVADAAKLRGTVEKLLNRIEEELPEEHLEAVQRKKYGQNLITLKINGGTMNPTFLIDDKWLCIGTSSQTVTAFALRLKGDLPSWKPDAETAEALAVVPKKFASISIAYPRPTYRGLVAAAPFLMGMGQAGIKQYSRFGQMPPLDLTITPMDLPPAEVVVKSLFPNVSWSVVDESGIHMTTRSSAPAMPLVGASDGGWIVVPAVLIASLLLPAVQQAREAARRTQSKNNLQQLGLAMHNFESTYRHFPQGTIPSRKLKPEERQSWLVALLPMMDQDALYNSMNVDLKESVKWDEDDLEDANQTVLPYLQNPSRAEANRPGKPGTTDYVGWAGVGKDAPTEKSKPEKKGIFGYDRATRMADITDGTSSTVMVSDVVAKTRGPWAQGGASTIRALTAKPYVNGPDGIGSPHVGGFHVGIADGAVRFISQNIDEKVLEALATRAGGETIGDY